MNLSEIVAILWDVAGLIRDTFRNHTAGVGLSAPNRQAGSKAWSDT
jgi:hypothetical protein